MRMNETFCWSANAGRWMGIPVRIHLFLILFLTAVIGVELTMSGSSSQVGVGTGIVTVLILMGSILIHELAHVFAIANLGGHVNNIVLMPWGGNSDFDLPVAGQARVTVHLAGPFVNTCIFGLGAIMLVQSANAEFFQLINPFRPAEFDTGEWQASLVKIVTWVNFQLAIVNLIPCFPFDGAAIVRSLINSLNVDLPKLRVESAIMVMGHAVAFTMIGLSWLVRDYSPGPIQPAWLLMLLGGIVLLFAARYSYGEETKITDADWDDAADMDYDSFYDDASFFDFPSESEHENSAYSQWLQEKKESRLQDELRAEEEEDRRADEILRKLHDGGLSSLTKEERSILDRVSARIRRNRQQGV